VVVVVVVVVVLSVARVQSSEVISLASRVTAASSDSARPSNVAFVCMSTSALAMMVPTKSVPTPIVAALPTCQNTLQGLAPFMKVTVLLGAVIRVDPAWKTHTEFGLLAPSRVSVPVSPKVSFP
jgi:hypothetical protein